MVKCAASEVRTDILSDVENRNGVKKIISISNNVSFVSDVRKNDYLKIIYTK